MQDSIPKQSLNSNQHLMVNGKTDPIQSIIKFSPKQELFSNKKVQLDKTRKNTVVNKDSVGCESNQEQRQSLNNFQKQQRSPSKHHTDALKKNLKSPRKPSLGQLFQFDGISSEPTGENIILESNVEVWNFGNSEEGSSEDTFTKSSLLRSTEISMLTSERNLNETLNEDDIQKIIAEKMKKMEDFNSRLEDKEEFKIIQKYKITKEKLDVIRRFQQRVRSIMIRKKFIKAVRMNKYLEHKKNYLKLKKCIQRFDKKHKGSISHFYYDKYVNL